MTPLGAQIVELLTRQGPMHAPAICKALNRDYSPTVPIMTALRKEGAIRVVGTAGQWGHKDVKCSAPMYGATGIVIVRAKRAPRGEGEKDAAPKTPRVPRKASKRTHSGSGSIAEKITIGRGYVWGAGLV